MKFDFQKSVPRGPFEGIALSEWQNWQWQMRQSLKTEAQFSQVYNLSIPEIEGFRKSKSVFQIRSTPYYVLLGSRENDRDPVRMMQVPRIEETESLNQEMPDPLGEEKNSVSPRLIHRYEDRVLFLITDFCSVYCRYCTRKRFTGQGHAFVDQESYQTSLDYIRKHSGIREVILSGGDPLTVADELLERVLKDLRSIDHVEIIRIGSRLPVANPFRITPALTKILRAHAPIFFMTHFNHPQEITGDAAEALSFLVDNGIPVMNQMVLLNGINNHAAVIQALSRRLLYLRVKPYYMFQCDPSVGTDHLRTSVEDSLQIQRELWGKLSGLAMPTLCVDIPDGGGKAAMVPQFQTSHDGRVWNFQGYDGVTAKYIDPKPTEIRKPVGIENYLEEWKELSAAKS